MFSVNQADCPSPGQPVLRHSQINSNFVATPNLKASAIRRPSTQKMRPSAASATSRRRRSAAGTFAFVNKSCNFTDLVMPLGWKRSPGRQCRKRTEWPIKSASKRSRLVFLGTRDRVECGRILHFTSTPENWIGGFPARKSTRRSVVAGSAAGGDTRSTRPVPALLISQKSRQE